MRISVLGAGSWGTTLAILLAEKQHSVSLWTHRPEFAQTLQSARENVRYLKGVSIPDTVFVTPELHAAESAEMIVVATPSQAVRETLMRLRDVKLNAPVVVCVSKGIEVGTGMRMSEVIRHTLPAIHQEQIVSLYGPSHAEEVSRKQPTTVVAASTSLQTARYVREAFLTPMFRVYSNPDLVGVEIAGSIKNIMAIAAGMVDGLGYGDNAKAALVTRGLAEIARLGAKFGANPLTFSGLAGIGDLIVTCGSKHSRNRFVGEQIGKGKTLKQVLEEMVMIAEGITTTKAAFELSQKLGVEMPITASVYEILFNDKSPRQALLDLMTRDPKDELT
ncbi:MAG: glycerol-3-phosphate dehydrogenase [[Candidatus Thermochlorobacteriaceae] bacterium GBChlB]|nr:MAG: glycerol-3-phosphate dehydrogenase [[Candidatus Thermochlorobacteriaceae] bacterium GBChlB]